LKGKVGLVLLVSLLVMAEVAAAQTTIQTTKEVIQSLDKIEIRDAKPIDFYPGVLIGSPRDYTVERVDIIYEKTDGNVTITLASMTIKSGKLIDGYVLAAWSKDVSFGTIILPGEDGWRAVETDIALFTNSAKTRTLITQSFKPTLSQHYASLMDAVAVAGKGEAYAKLKEMLKYVSEVVKRDLKEFDRVVESSRATVSVYGLDVGILSEQIDSKYLDVLVQSDDPTNPYLATISGTFSSWRDSEEMRHIEFAGSFAFMNAGQVMIDPWYTISYEKEEPVWGWAVLTQSRGVGHQYVTYICWIGVGGWNVIVKTYQFSTSETSVPVYLFAWSHGESDGDRAYLRVN